jgi:sulfur-oxidizing protein SoxY
VRSSIPDTDDNGIAAGARNFVRQGSQEERFMALYLTHRQKLAACFSALTMAMLGRSNNAALADQNAVDQVIKQFTRGQTPIVGQVRLDLAATTDDGSSVPVTVSVDSPMTEDSYVTSVLLVADGNTRPVIITFYFTSASGVAEASTRIRLAKPAAGMQNVTAVARLNDGSCYAITKMVTVTDAGCG